MKDSDTIIDKESMLAESGILSFIDIHFARLMERYAAARSDELFLASALTSAATREGHICLDLAGIAGAPLRGTENWTNPVHCPEQKHWISRLREMPVVGREGDFKPLILDLKGRLYLYRYWDYQCTVAQYIRSRAKSDAIGAAMTPHADTLKRYFPEGTAGSTNWQKIAALVATVKKFSVISGGPGTGKTTTVAAILAMLCEHEKLGALRIALVAPTGKAATRLTEAIEESQNALPCNHGVKEAITRKATTIHRLLRSIPNTPYFRFNRQNRLSVDVVVVDEASMVDLALMAKLVRALPDHSRLILLGDKDQLSSVEAGAVLGDICDTGRSYGFSERFGGLIEEVTGEKLADEKRGANGMGINDCIVQLRRSFRFHDDSGIGKVSRAVNAGDDQRVFEILKAGQTKDIVLERLPSAGDLMKTIRQTVIKEFGGYLRESTPSEALQRFGAFRILCAVREGPYGVHTINTVVERILQDAGLTDSARLWYRGRPVLITTNDYNLNLFNGDVGLAFPDPGADGEYRVFFPESKGTVRKIHPFRLPAHETVYATTVHRSQGSEYDRVFLILPDTYSPVLTRELIYTGITRAREKVTIYGIDSILQQAIARKIERTSGLRDALWE